MCILITFKSNLEPNIYQSLNGFLLNNILIDLIPIIIQSMIYKKHSFFLYYNFSSIINTSIFVWWKEKGFYRGKITKFDETTGFHWVLYDDIIGNDPGFYIYNY